MPPPFLSYRVLNMSVSPPILQQMENLENISADSTPCTSATNVGDNQTCERRILEQLRDVTVMNDKWQKYNKERERYVDGIRRDLEKTKKKLQARDKELMEMKARERELEKTIRDNQNTIRNFSKLMDDLDEKEAKERTLSMRVCELEKEVDSLRRMNNTTEANAENEQLLQQQVIKREFIDPKKKKTILSRVSSFVSNCLNPGSNNQNMSGIAWHVCDEHFILCKCLMGQISDYHYN